MLIGINKRSETIVFHRALAIADLNLGSGTARHQSLGFRFSTAEKMRFLDCVQFSQRGEESSEGGLMYRC